MKALLSGSAIALALVLTGCGSEDGANGSASVNTSAPLEQIPAPNGGDWTQVVSETPEGGFRMGNPDAPVKLVEYGSLTCGACANFAETGAPQIEEKYVKSGQVSFEFRNFVRDAADMAAALLSRCGGATPYFKLTDQMFAAQQQWLGSASNLDAAAQQRLSSLPPQQQIGEYARILGLVDFVKMRGIPEAKANACLADKAALDKLISMQNVANTEHQLQGTPTFLINGNVLPSVVSWDQLEPAIREALN